MEVMMSAVSSMGSALSGMFAGGSSLAAAGGTSAAGLGSMSSGFSALSGLSSMGGGVLKMFQGFANAEGARAQGKLDRIAGEHAVLDIAEERNRIIANNLVAAAASGLDVSAGEPADAAALAEKDAQKAIDRERMNTAMKGYAANRMARAAQLSGVMGLVDGFTAGAKEMSTSATRTARRGA